MFFDSASETSQVLVQQSGCPRNSKADIIEQAAANRDQLRQSLVTFLSPEQLKKWDAEVSTAKAARFTTSVEIR